MTPIYKVTATLEFHRPMASTAMDRDAMAGAGEQFGLHGRVTSLRPTRAVAGGHVEVEIDVEYNLGGRADSELIALIFEELDSTEAESFTMQVEKDTRSSSYANVQIHQVQRYTPGAGASFVIGNAT